MDAVEQIGRGILNHPESRTQGRGMDTIDLVDRIDETVARLTCVASLLAAADIKSMRLTKESVAGLVSILNDAVDGLHAAADTLARQEDRERTG